MATQSLLLNLPNYLIEDIVAMIPQHCDRIGCAASCRRLRDVCASERLWRDVVLDGSRCGRDSKRLTARLDSLVSSGRVAAGKTRSITISNFRAALYDGGCARPMSDLIVQARETLQKCSVYSDFDLDGDELSKCPTLTEVRCRAMS